MAEQLDLFAQPVAERIEFLTFNQAVNLFVAIYWNRKKMAASTRSTLRYLVSFFDGRLIHLIGRQDMQNVMHHLANNILNCRNGKMGLGPSAINKAKMIMTLLYRKLEEWKLDGVVGDHDFSRLTLPSRNPGLLVKRLNEEPDDRFYSPWEYRQWLRAARSIGDYGLVDAIRLGVWLRLSPIDLVELNDDEIDGMEIRVYRRHTKTDQNPKGQLQVCALTEKVWGLIERCRRYRNPGEKRILNLVNKRRRLKRLRKKVIEMGGRDFTLRHLRKSGSGRLFELGYDIQTVQEGNGHASPRTTRKWYTPPRNPNLRKATQKLVEEYSG